LAQVSWFCQGNVLHDPHFCHLSEKLGGVLIVRGENRSETTADDNRKRIKHIPPTYSPEHIIPVDLIFHHFLTLPKKQANTGEMSKVNKIIIIVM